MEIGCFNSGTATYSPDGFLQLPLLMFFFFFFSRNKVNGFPYLYIFFFSILLGRGSNTVHFVYSLFIVSISLFFLPVHSYYLIISFFTSP